jgi:hypothetical protein
MSHPFTPHSLIPDALVRALRESAAAAEASGSLTADQLSVIFREGWFRMFVTKAHKGLELSLPEGLQLQEALAWIDGSLGWTVTLCSGATMFVGYMDEALAASLLSDPAACFGGSGQPSGVATITSSGYKISGKWRYATGAPHLSIFTANCVIEQDGQPLQTRDGLPVIRSFFFKRDEVSIVEDWHTMGLKATAGHSFEVTDLTVPADRSFIISPEAAQAHRPIYHYPFLPFAEATLAVNTSGMTLHFLDICEQIFADRGSNRNYGEETVSMLNTQLISAKNELVQLRVNFYNAVAHSWTPLAEHGISRYDLLETVSITSRTLVRECRQLVHDLYPYCGMAGANADTELNRVWRDIFTASQHTLLTYPGV